MTLNLALIFGVFLLQESICTTNKIGNRNPEDYKDLSGKFIMNEHYPKLYFPDKIEIEDDRVGGKDGYVIGGKLIGEAERHLSGKTREDFIGSEDNNTKGKIEEENRIGGKYAFIKGGKLMGKAERYTSEKVAEDFVDSEDLKLKGKIEDDKLGGKDAFVGGKLMGKAERYISGKTPEDFRDSFGYNLKGKIEDDKLGGKDAFVGGKLIGKAERDISEKTPEDFRNSIGYNLKNDQNEVGGEYPFVIRVPIAPKAEGKMPGKLSDALKPLHLKGMVDNRLGGKGTIIYRGLLWDKIDDATGKNLIIENFVDQHAKENRALKAVNSQTKATVNMENSAVHLPWNLNSIDFHRVYPVLGYWLRSTNTPNEQKFHANRDECLKFFFSVQEVPHYFAGVSDALLKATKSALPLALKVTDCTKGSFVESMTCVRSLEPEIRDYYITLAPIFKPPIQAFHAQLVKVKEELEGCLVIKANDGI